MNTSKKPSKNDSKSSAPALSRGLRVLELLSTSIEPQSLTSIAKNLGIAASSAHSICSTLMQEGYIEKRSDNSYELTLKILNIASSKIHKYNIAEHFNDICEKIPLIRRSGVVLSMLDGSDIYYIACRNSPQPLGAKFNVGLRLPACCTASGRALLATLSDDEIKHIYPNEELPQITKASLKSRDKLLKMLEKFRKQGYSEEKRGTWPHMYSYGALVSTPNNKPIAGVAVSLYADDVTNELEQQAIEATIELAKQLSEFSNLLG